MMWGYRFNGFSWGGMLLMLFNMLFWFGLLGLLVWALVRWITGRAPTGTGTSSTMGPSALEILRQRYARGELDEATFLRMREQLETYEEHSS
jgi:putative membrane protein